jgi:phosphatidylinositol phospholipase C, beta
MMMLLLTFGFTSGAFVHGAFGTQVQELVADQTKEWTDMVMRQMAEEHEMLKAHVGQLTELLRELMEDAQDLQMKELELRQEK